MGTFLNLAGIFATSLVVWMLVVALSTWCALRLLDSGRVGLFVGIAIVQRTIWGTFIGGGLIWFAMNSYLICKAIFG